MSRFVVELKDVLVILANKLLPAKSGYKKILEIIVQMTQADKEERFVKIIFWRPNNSMLVAYTVQSRLTDFEDSDIFKITSNHDSTWRYDGFSFFHKVMSIPYEVLIFSVKEIEIQEMFPDDAEQTCYFTLH